MAAGTVTSSFGAPRGPQLKPVGELAQAGVGGGSTSRLGVNRACSVPATARDGFGQTSSEQPRLDSVAGCISVPWIVTDMFARVSAAISCR